MSAARRKAKQKNADTKEPKYKTFLEIKHDGLPPTTNNLYVNGKKGRFSAREGVNYKQMVALLVQADLGSCLLDPFEWYELRIMLYLPMLNKGDGMPKRWDASNYIKALEDGICEAAGIDDRMFRSVIATKQPIKHGEPERTVASIEPIQLPFCGLGGGA